MKEERKEKRKIVEIQKGVRLYIDEDGNCIDVDIEDGIKTLIFDGSGYFDFDSLYGKKSFPDITELHIGRDVQYICIRNKVFPNIRKITSDSPYFKSGNLLVSIPDYVVDMLKDGDVDEKYIKTSHRFLNVKRLMRFCIIHTMKKKKLHLWSMRVICLTIGQRPPQMRLDRCRI